MYPLRALGSMPGLPENEGAGLVPHRHQILARLILLCGQTLFGRLGESGDEPAM